MIEATEECALHYCASRLTIHSIMSTTTHVSIAISETCVRVDIDLAELK